MTSFVYIVVFSNEGVIVICDRREMCDSSGVMSLTVTRGILYTSVLNRCCCVISSSLFSSSRQSITKHRMGQWVKSTSAKSKGLGSSLRLKS